MRERGKFMSDFFAVSNVRGLAAFIILLLQQFVSAEAVETEDRISIVDYYGALVVLDKSAESVVSLSPGITETIFAIGHGKLLVGRSAYCDYPPEAAGITVVGSIIEPNIELIVDLSPDIVIASTHFTREDFKRLTELGLKVVVLNGQESFGGVYDGVIRPVAALLGDLEAGEKLISSMQVTIAEAMEKVKRFSSNPTVYYVVGFGEGGDWTAGGDTFIGEMITLAGGKNIAEDVSGWSFNLESLVRRDPDIILIPPWAKELFPTTPVYSDLRAVQNGNVLVVDEKTISRQGPRTAKAFAGLVDTLGAFR